jgi:GH15 family glucan-1,4-alpha-glucosidase
MRRLRLAHGKMLTYAKHVGLYSEEIQRPAARHLPQAFTHLARIGAAYKLDRALG